jgi:hypothetical protein
MGHSPESAFALWAIAQDLAQCCGPLRRFWFRCLSHSKESALNQIRAGSHEYPLLCIHVNMVMYPHLSGCLSTCRIWLCTMYSTCGHVTKWSSVHMHLAVYPNAEFGYALWVTAQKFLRRYWYRLQCRISSSAESHRRMIDYCAELHELLLAACPTLEGIVRQKTVHFLSALSKAYAIHA